jgi:hypothetical protein
MLWRLPEPSPRGQSSLPAPAAHRHEARPPSPTKFSVCRFSSRRRTLVEKMGIWSWIDGRQANPESIGVWGFGLSTGALRNR